MSVWTATGIFGAIVFAFGLFCAYKAKHPKN